MKIYTRTGDEGETGLFGGPRVRKDAARIEAYGTVDELNAVLGLALATGLPAEIAAVVERVQHELFDLGAQLATPDPAKHHTELVSERLIAALEQDIDLFETKLAPLKQFILPGGTTAAAHVHVARTVCRRAERRLITLAHAPAEMIAPAAIVYLNRLSDLLFVLARAANALEGVTDVPWRKPG